MELKYQFRERMLKVYKKDIIDYSLTPDNDDFVISDGIIITLPEKYDEPLITAAKDLIEYLFISMNRSARIGNNGNVLFDLSLDKENGKDCFDIKISDKIYVCATDSRTAAQAIYFLEDLMSERKAPFIKKGTYKKVLNFSPRIILPSGYVGHEIQDIPDAYFAHMAHNGFNALMIGVNNPANLDKCRKYGFDIYICSNIPSKYHPDDPEAKEYYASTYGKLAGDNPQIKGIVLVGEAIGFPSKDPNTSGGHRTKPVDNIPSLKTDTGFYPCNDYYKLVNIIKESVRETGSDAEIVFWSYNFWGHPLEKRLEMIDNLPTDIVYMVTFELSEQYEMDGITKFVCDYSISRPGPCPVFIEEASYAKKRGMKIYSMTSTAGMTWDFGPIPYMPMPQKWIKRYKSMYEAQEKYGLDGMLEAWSTGFYPSVVSELAKKCFMDKDSDFDSNLRIILKKHFDENADTVYKALDLWSEASDYIHSTYDEQYGPLRIGTAYPLAFLSMPNPPVGSPWLSYKHGHGASMYQTLYATRDEVETKHWIKMSELMMEGVNLLKSIENPSEEIELLTNLGKYIYHCVVTVINLHRWHKCRDWIVVEPDKSKVREIIDEMKKIASDEDKNALDSIECLRKDSRLGYEPGDGYTANEESVLWKVKYTKFVLEKELKKFEKELSL